VASKEDLARGYGKWPNLDSEKAGKYFADLLDDRPSLVEDLDYGPAVKTLSGLLLAVSSEGRLPKDIDFNPEKVVWEAVAEDLVSRRNLKETVIDTMSKIYSMMPASIHEIRGNRMIDLNLVPIESGFSIHGKIGDVDVCLTCAQQLGGTFLGTTIVDHPSDLSREAPTIAFRVCEGCQVFIGKRAASA
jgi:hypothetical protein